MVHGLVREVVHGPGPLDWSTDRGSVFSGHPGYSCRHLHQRIEEHKGSAIGRHIKEQHGKEPDNIEKNFKILRKCQSKLDCLIFEMLFIRLLKPKLNKQSDSLRAKLFV